MSTSEGSCLVDVVLVLSVVPSTAIILLSSDTEASHELKLRGDSRIEKRGVLRMSARFARAKFWDHAHLFTGHTHTFLIIRIV